MHTFAVGLWKEWRDHRLVSVVLLVVLPVLVFASAWAFRSEVPPADFGPLTLFTLNVAQALYVLAVASESFGGERRRGTLDFLRRLPRGLGRSCGAKLAAYVLGNLVALAWGAGVAWTACALFGPNRAVGDFATTLLRPDPITALLAGGLFVLGLWTLLISNFIPQGGAATVGAALLLGLLAVPVFFALKDRPWLVRVPSIDLIVWGLAGLAALGFLALVVAFLRGNRLLASAWSPAWRALAMIGVVATGGYAWGAVALDRALTIDPRDEQFHIAEAYLATGGRYLYLTVFRGDQAYIDENQRGAGDCTPHQPWIVDLHDGTWRIAGEYQSGWTPLAWNNGKVPQPIVKLRTYATDDDAWYDAATATRRKVLRSDVRTPDVLAWQRSVMPTVAWHHDDQGRALWLEGERVVREGEAVRPGWGSVDKHQYWDGVIPGGWLRTTQVTDERGHARFAWWIADAATGASRLLDRMASDVGNDFFLSSKTCLVRSYPPQPAGRKSPRGPLGLWTLVDIETGTVSPTSNPPAADFFMAALPRERALLMAGNDKRHLTLSVWDPRTGETTPVLDAKGEPFVGFSGHVEASAPGGLKVLCVWSERDGVATCSWALFNETTGRTRRLPILDGGRHVVCMESEDSVVMLAGKDRVERYFFSTRWVGREPSFGVETLFPRGK